MLCSLFGVLKGMPNVAINKCKSPQFFANAKRNVLTYVTTKMHMCSVLILHVYCKMYYFFYFSMYHTHPNTVFVQSISFGYSHLPLAYILFVTLLIRV